MVKIVSLAAPMLLNAEEMARTYPDTFIAPSEDELRRLRAGDYVKLCYPTPGRLRGVPTTAERFWCELTDLSTFPILIGRVDNDLLAPWPKYNDLLRFHACNVYEILTAEQLAHENNQRRP